MGTPSQGGDSKEKRRKEKREKGKEKDKVRKSGQNEEDSTKNSSDSNVKGNTSTVKDMRKFMSSVADRVGLERGMGEEPSVISSGR